jgi:hypothetical protein
MLYITSSDVIRKPSFITKPQEITFIEDAKQHVVKSVVLPYELYRRFQTIIEDELYLIENKKALSKNSYKEFLEMEEVCEDLDA